LEEAVVIAGFICGAVIGGLGYLWGYLVGREHERWSRQLDEPIRELRRRLAERN